MMTLDPKARRFLEQQAAQAAAAGPQPKLAEMPSESVRRMLNGILLTLDNPPEAVARVDELKIPGPGGSIPARMYTPEGKGLFPVLVYFHGGGWVVGTLETHDTCCRALAVRAGCVVVSVDYRLAPEHKFPAAAEDAYAATCWVAEKGASLDLDPARIAVGGDSAGGNLATVVCLMARDRNGPRLCHQLLIDPGTNHSFDTPSYRENAEGYYLTKEKMIYFWNQYLPDEASGRHPHASPLQAPDLGALPPALIITAGYDPLRDEDEDYANRLRAAGVPVKLSRYESMIHGFIIMGAVVDHTRAAREEAARALRAAFGSVNEASRTQRSGT
jgi:acetyl esterase/lipase